MKTPRQYFTKPPQKIVYRKGLGKGIKKGDVDMEEESNGEKKPSSPKPSTSGTTPCGKGKKIGIGKGKENRIKIVKEKRKRKEKVIKSKKEKVKQTRKKNKPQNKRNDKPIFNDEDDEMPLATWIKKYKSDDPLTKPSTSGINNKNLGANGKDDEDDIPLATLKKKYKSEKALVKPSTSGINNNAKKISNKKESKRSNGDRKKRTTKVSVDDELSLKETLFKRYVKEVLEEVPAKPRISQEAFKKVMGSADNFLTDLLKNGKKIHDLGKKKCLNDLTLDVAHDLCYKNLFDPLEEGIIYIPRKKKSNCPKKKKPTSSSAVAVSATIAMPPPPSPAPLPPPSPSRSTSASKSIGKSPRTKKSSPPASPYNRPPASPRKTSAGKETSGKAKGFAAASPTHLSPAPVFSLATQPSPVATFPQQEYYNQAYQNSVNVPAKMNLVPYNSQIQAFQSPSLPVVQYQSPPTPPPHSPHRSPTPNLATVYEPITSPITPVFEENLFPVY